MLKWLKRGPSAIGNTSNSDGIEIGSATEWVHKTTDDPLATIQSNSPKKITNPHKKLDGIYSVSRINPLFEEDDPNSTGKETVEIHSGSSGYESGPSDDNDSHGRKESIQVSEVEVELYKHPKNQTNYSSSVKLADNSLSKLKHQRHDHLFLSQEDLLYEHKATLDEEQEDEIENEQHLSPILNVLTQNSNFVNSIAVSIQPPVEGEPIEPIAESKIVTSSLHQHPYPGSKTEIPVPIRSINEKGESSSARKLGDEIGVAKLIQTNKNYVQSIRIVPSRGPTGSAWTSSQGRIPRDSSINKKAFTDATKSTGFLQLSRKPSVTFADEVVSNGKILGRESTSRNIQEVGEQDSIVSESLLMLTSSKNSGSIHKESSSSVHQQTNSRPNFTTHQKSIFHGRNRTIPLSTISDLRENDPKTTEKVLKLDETDEMNQSLRSLTELSNSLSKHPIVKRFISRNSASPHPSDVNDDTIEEANEIVTQQRPRHITSSSKSPFGGIADHYAAAKEIAKEIESYSFGTSKSNKISLVKNLLLSSRGRVGGVLEENHSTTTILAGITPSLNDQKFPIFKKIKHLNEMDSNPSTNEALPVLTNSSSVIEEQSLNIPKPPPLPHSTKQSNHASSSSEQYYSITNNIHSSSSTKKLYFEGIKKGDHLFIREKPQVYVKAINPSSTIDPIDEELLKPFHSSNIHVKMDNFPLNISSKGHKTSIQPKISTININPQKIAMSNDNMSKLKNPQISNLVHLAKNNPQIVHYQEFEGQNLQIPIYETLSSGSVLQHHQPNDNDSDSGNSTDRHIQEEHSGDESPPIHKNSSSTIQSGQNSIVGNNGTIPLEQTITNKGVLNETSQNNRQSLSQNGLGKTNNEINTGRKTNRPASSKVMLVSGDRQNVVVDLSGIPPDLRDVMMNGSTLVAIPDELTEIDSSSTSSGSGYAILPISSVDKGLNPEYEILPVSKIKNSDEKKQDFGIQNITQAWTSSQGILNGNSKGKHVTTCLPYHPNTKIHTTADFTIDGHILARQTKRVKQLKKRRCICRICGTLIFILAFLGVIVTLSLVYTKGKHYFGPV